MLNLKRVAEPVVVTLSNCTLFAFICRRPLTVWVSAAIDVLETVRPAKTIGTIWGFDDLALPALAEMVFATLPLGAVNAVDEDWLAR